MVLAVHHVQLERRGLMFTLNRLSVSLSAITFGLGLFVGGCASETEEPNADPSTPVAQADQTASPAEPSAAQGPAALPQGDEQHLGKNASEIGFYGGWGYPIGAGWGWGGAVPWGWGG